MIAFSLLWITRHIGYGQLSRLTNIEMVTHSMDSEALSVDTEQELIGCNLYEKLHMVQSSEPKKKMMRYKAGTSLTQVTGSLYTASFPSLVPLHFLLFGLCPKCIKNRESLETLVT